MSRPLRLEFEGALYHITSRGDRRENIYEDDRDRQSFLKILGNVCEQYHWVCHGYCLMSNHYHLIIETPDANLSKGMRQLNGVYSQDFNRVHGRIGHVFQGRYKAIHVDKESYLLELSRYVVLNPVRAYMVENAGDWQWSNYLATIREIKPYKWLETDYILSSFSVNKKRAIESYKNFVTAGERRVSIWSELKSEVFLGDDKFVERLQHLVDQEKDLSEIPLAQRRSKPLSLEEYQSKENHRNAAICLAYASGGYSQKELGDYFGLHYSRVSRILKKAKGKT